MPNDQNRVEQSVVECISRQTPKVLFCLLYLQYLLPTVWYTLLQSTLPVPTQVLGHTDKISLHCTALLYIHKVEHSTLLSWPAGSPRPDSFTSCLSVCLSVCLYDNTYVDGWCCVVLCCVVLCCVVLWCVSDYVELGVDRACIRQVGTSPGLQYWQEHAVCSMFFSSSVCMHAAFAAHAMCSLFSSPVPGSVWLHVLGRYLPVPK